MLLPYGFIKFLKTEKVALKSNVGLYIGPRVPFVILALPW